MARLSELETADLIKILLYGDAGTGKTIFAAGFPTPILYFDFDGKVNSAARFFRGQPRLDEIEVVNLQAELRDSPMDEFTRRTEELIKWQKEKNYPFRTLVIDSITTFSQACLNYTIKANHGIKRMPVKMSNGKMTEQPSQQDYGILHREFQRLIPGLLTLDMNVVMLGHISVDKDETTGQVLRNVMMDGKFAQKLPIYFDEVYRSYVEEKGGIRTYLAQTQPDALFKFNRSQIPGLPPVIPLKYEELVRQR